MGVPSGLALTLLELSRVTGCCVWKGASHLEESLNGSGDLDVLVSPRAALSAEALLRRSGFLAAGLAHPCDQPGLKDWLGYDGRRLLHVQLYDQMVLGDRIRGWWRLPHADDVLRTVREKPPGVLVPSPEVEALLILVRAALRSPAVDAVVPLAGGLPSSTWRRQWEAQLGLTTRTEVAAVAARWFGSSVGSLVASDEFRFHSTDLAALRRLMQGSMTRVGDHLPRRLTRLLALALHKADRRLGRGTRLVKRGCPGGGFCAVIAGPDARFTVSDLCSTFAGKLDVHRVTIPRVRDRPHSRPLRRAGRARRSGRLVLVGVDRVTTELRQMADLVVDAANPDGTDRSQQTAERVWSALLDRASG
ncbi:MAG TPA: hypothetical protein VFX33_07650 [Actinomycetales bacterium]|nr:hypothetical protein [Actinomycetales bacterium]